MLSTLWNATYLYGHDRNKICLLRRTKFLLRALIQLPHSAQWFRFLQEQPELAAALPQQRQWLHKLQRPYLCADYDSHNKLQLLHQHFSLFLERLPAALRSSLLQNQVLRMASIAGKSGMRYHIKLSLTQTMDKEGELMLTLEEESSRYHLATLAFSFGTDQEKMARIYIGCLQGPRHQGGREHFRAVTKDLHGLMPKVLLMKALYALARPMGIDTVLAVSNRSHVHQAAWHRYTAIQADYDAFWMMLGGCRLNDRHFQLKTSGIERPLADIPANKRAQYQRRRELEHSIAQQFTAFWPAAQEVNSAQAANCSIPAGSAASGADCADLCSNSRPLSPQTSPGHEVVLRLA
ncbi:virulence factor VirK [Aquitalea magnusonii]|uniref:Virulence factor VirK n=1 Tax=Aquitalea magnusonii TaxID=332411 RepID=A0A3G9GBH0_9NEIS|nr:DUF535 family protein [Aquitalea magnusonii]BBF85230.1 virulence factor VirK [Aquitalea magnusonii]